MRKDLLMLKASLRHARDTGHKMVMNALYLYGVRTITCLECDTQFEITEEGLMPNDLSFVS